MICTKCNNNVEEKFKFCPYCGQVLSTLSGNNIKTGDNSYNVGVGNSGNQNIHIGDNINLNKKENIVEYENMKDRLVLGGVSGFKTKSILAGILSVISSIITIISFLYDSESFVLFLCCIIFLGYFSYDNMYKYKKLLNEGVIKENNVPKFIVEEDSVWIMSKFGICPICGGKVRIKYDQNEKKSIGKCEKNPQEHIFTYDRTIEKGYFIKTIIVRSE